MAFDKTQSTSLRLIRAVAVCLVLATHITQAYGSWLSSWTDTGVQLFLASSGFILGQPKQIQWREWALRRMLRILPSYYIVLAGTALGYWLFASANILNMQFAAHITTLHFLFFPGYPSWGGHLWYITAIVLCYCLFPVLKASTRLNSRFFLFLHLAAMPFLLFILFFGAGLPYRLSGDIYCFVLGFVIASRFSAAPPVLIAAALAACSVAVAGGESLLMQTPYAGNEFLQAIMQAIWPWKRALYGVSIMLVLYRLPVQPLSAGRAVSFLGTYSYEIYLAGNIFILGVFSLLHLTNHRILNIALALTGTFLSAYVVHQAAGALRQTAANRRKYQPRGQLPAQNRS